MKCINESMQSDICEHVSTPRAAVVGAVLHLVGNLWQICSEAFRLDEICQLLNTCMKNILNLQDIRILNAIRQVIRNDKQFYIGAQPVTDRYIGALDSRKRFM